MRFNPVLFGNGSSIDLRQFFVAESSVGCHSLEMIFSPKAFFVVRRVEPNTLAGVEK